MKKTFPRLDAGTRNDRVETLLRLSDLSEVSALRQSLSEDGFYSWSSVEQVRVSQAELHAFVEALTALATAHGFPSKPYAGSRQADQASPHDEDFGQPFDLGLVAIVQEHLGISVAEAADNSTWDALRIGLIPDILLWRCPPVESAGVEGGQIMLRPNYLWTDRRRGFLKQAWWYGHVLGYDLVKELNARELADILERSSIGRLGFFAREIADEYLRLKASASAENVTLTTDRFRVAIKSVRRQLGVVSVGALSPEARKVLIRNELEMAFQGA